MKYSDRVFLNQGQGWEKTLTLSHENWIYLFLGGGENVLALTADAVRRLLRLQTAFLFQRSRFVAVRPSRCHWKQRWMSERIPKLRANDLLHTGNHSFEYRYIKEIDISLNTVPGSSQWRTGADLDDQVGDFLVWVEVESIFVMFASLPPVWVAWCIEKCNCQMIKWRCPTCSESVENFSS